jgi:hypothetical protein
MPDQWHRALLRAQLREQGYDALGAPDLAGSLLYTAAEPERGPVGLIVLDQQAVLDSDDRLLAMLLSRHGRPPSILIAPAGRPALPGDWRLVVTRPLSIADLVQHVSALLPPAPESERPGE